MVTDTELKYIYEFINLRPCSPDTRHKPEVNGRCALCGAEKEELALHCYGYSTPPCFDRAVEKGELDFVDGKLIEGALAVAAVRVDNNPVIKEKDDGV